MIGTLIKECNISQHTINIEQMADNTHPYRVSVWKLDLNRKGWRRLIAVDCPTAYFAQEVYEMEIEKVKEQMLIV